MSWPVAFAVGLLTAAAGALTAGLVASLCVGWYGISGFEGGSGYFVVGLGLVGLVVGLVIGVAAARVLGPGGGFVVAAGRSLAAVAGVGLAIAGVARLNAHVGPTLGGEALNLLVEVRMPPGWAPNNRARADDNHASLTALARGRRMADAPGHLRWRDATREGDRWTVRALVPVFTTRGQRLVDLHVGGEHTGIVVPVPGRPAAEQLAWSAWRTDGFTQPVDGPPVTGHAYRFRVEPASALARRDSVAAAERAAAEGREYAALSPESPLAAWVRYASYEATGEERARARQVLAARFAEFPMVIEQADGLRLVQAGYALANLDPMPADGRAVMREIGRAIARRAVRWSDGQPAGDADVRVAKGLEDVTRAWIERWRRAWPHAPAEIRSELEALVAVAATRGDAEPMREIAYLAERALEEIGAPPAAPGAATPADAIAPAKE